MAKQRYNPFVARSRQRARQAAPVRPQRQPEPAPVPVAEPVDLNPDPAEHTQTPDIPAYATGGPVEAPKPILVEPSADEQHEQAAEPESDAKRGRGRPRPQETIDRDNAVHELLKASGEFGLPKADIATDLQEKEQQVYSSLRQLAKEGRAETRYVKDVGYRWFAAVSSDG